MISTDDKILQAEISKAPKETALKIESIVQRALNFIPRKVAAGMLYPPVSEQVISQWLSGVRKVPDIRQVQILAEAKRFIKEQHREAIDVEDQIDAYLLMQFGSNKDE